MDNHQRNIVPRGWINTLIIGALICGCARFAGAQQTVTGQVNIVRQTGAKSGQSPDGNSYVAVWLVPLDASVVPITTTKPVAQIAQRNKMFDPHMLVVQAGSTVQFPNMDPFFHNVFSLFNGKRFDLGLYEAGTSKSVRFDRVGVSFLFCNIHEEMTAVVVAVPTPYFAISDRVGHVTITNVPDGRYQLQVWYEHSTPDDLKKLEHMVAISAGHRTLDAISVGASNVNITHTNKYGESYVPPPAAGYSKP